MQNLTDTSLTAFAEKFIDNTNRHIFLTGKAGTGKTTFLRHITESTYKNAVVTAPTGVAAINAGGVTLHSMFHLPFGTYIPEGEIGHFNPSVQLNTRSSMLKEFRMNNSKRKLIREMELLIIDEVSMLRADLLDAIDAILRHVRRNNLPFGGVQILFIGDLLQLPPVVKNHEMEYLRNFYSDLYFFQALALQQSSPIYIELEKVYRQTDSMFISLLNRLRENTITKDDVALLNTHHQPDYDGDAIQLCTHNNTASGINSKALKEIDSKSYFYDAEISGDFNDNAFPLEPRLELKKGAKVMFMKNDITGQQRYFNGKIGEVSHLSSDEIFIDFDDDSSTVMVEPYEWENSRFTLDKSTNEIQKNTIGTFTQYPLKLAWAITIHKSQGLTFDKAAIDISAVFVSGQTYVALSRLRTLEGLVLLSPIKLSGLSPDKSISDYSENKLDEAKLEQEYSQASLLYFRDFVQEAFNLNPLKWEVSNHLQTYAMDENRSAKQKYEEWAKELQIELLPLIEVSEKFESQIKHICGVGEIYSVEKLQERTIAAKNYFEPLLKKLHANVQKHREEVNKKKKVKQYGKELEELQNAFHNAVRKIYKAETLLESAKNNSSFNKENLDAFDREAMKKQEVSKASLKKGTKDISYEMYKSGKNMAEIAKERGFGINTIEGHLAHYVQQGLIDVEDLLEKDRVKVITQKITDLKNPQLGEIKSVLPSTYSYGEIKLVLASLAYVA